MGSGHDVGWLLAKAQSAAPDSVWMQSVLKVPPYISDTGSWDCRGAAAACNI